MRSVVRRDGTQLKVVTYGPRGWVWCGTTWPPGEVTIWRRTCRGPSCRSRCWSRSGTLQGTQIQVSTNQTHREKTAAGWNTEKIHCILCFLFYPHVCELFVNPEPLNHQKQFKANTNLQHMKFPLIIWAAETSAAGLEIGATAGLEQKYRTAGCDLHLSFHTVTVRTRCSLSIERLTHAAGVLGHHFNIVGGSGLQVVQRVRAHVAHKEVHGLACGAWNTTAPNKV